MIYLTDYLVDRVGLQGRLSGKGSRVNSNCQSKLLGFRKFHSLFLNKTASLVESRQEVSSLIPGSDKLLPRFFFQFKKKTAVSSSIFGVWSCAQYMAILGIWNILDNLYFPIFPAMIHFSEGFILSKFVT